MARDFSALNNFSKNVKKPADNTTKITLNNFSNKAIKLEEVEITHIKLSLIRERQDDNGNLTNEFHEARTDLLEQSIEENGLMNPLILVKLPEADANGRTYQIVSGHRRFISYKNILTKWIGRRGKPAYSQDLVEQQISKFETIPARVFGLDKGQSTKEQSLPYITEGQEHSIYLETNFETRGLTFEDSLLYVDELREKIKNDMELKRFIAEQTYQKRLEKNPKARRRVTEDSDLDELGEDTFLSYYLSEVMQIKGWSRPSVSRYLYICDYENKTMVNRLKASIKAGDISIRKAYDNIKKLENPTEETEAATQNREGRYINKIKAIQSLADSLQLKNGTSYTTDQLLGIQKELQVVQTIISEELAKRNQSESEA